MLPRKEDLQNKINQAQRMVLPTEHLFPIQGVSEWRNTSLSEVRRGVQTAGKEYLYWNPIIVCLLKQLSGYTAVVLDGNHRLEVARENQITQIPAFVFMLEQLVDNTQSFSKVQTEMELRSWADMAVESLALHYSSVDRSLIPNPQPIAMINALATF